MKKVTAICTAGALAVVMIAAVTFAWFTAKDSVTNRLATARITDGSVNVVEVFTPPKTWLPGQEIKKQVAVANNGSGSVFVRVGFEEVMEKLNVPAKSSELSIDQQTDKELIPQLFNAAPYLEGEWVDVTNQFASIEGLPSPIPDGLTLKMRTAAVEKGKTSHSFVFLYKIQTGDYKDQYQRVTADFDITDNVLTIKNLAYWDFGKLQHSEMAWAAVTNRKTSGVPIIRPVSDIGFPYTDKTDKKISLNYNKLTELTGTTPTDKMWWYNAKDGFFYYIASLPAGGITPFLLDSLKLADDAGQEYSGMVFDLIVNMEAIQNTSDALLSSTGWKLAETDALYIALKGHCDPPS
ncbi:MAG: BsaA family SipW-dependent biofilm matrix protein [Coriobacteriales bacterium]|nr:BsaA family SipW-dependent biofilm matrix protein [Coriobacteriales bacterium]